MRRPASFAVQADKRATLELAIEHLVEQAAVRPETIALPPAGSPWGNVLVDTAIDTKWRRPPGRARRYAPRVALLLPLLYFSSIAWFNGRADVVSYVVSGPNASISPDSGPSSGCTGSESTCFAAASATGNVPSPNPSFFITGCSWIGMG